jgi:hypothetical protein
MLHLREFHELFSNAVSIAWRDDLPFPSAMQNTFLLSPFASTPMFTQLVPVELF